MKRKDGTINPDRLANYFRKAKDLAIEESAHYLYPFPERDCYRLRVNWPEIAAEFEQSFKE